MNIEKFFNESMLDTLFENRYERFSHEVLKTSKENKNMRDNIENRLKSLLNFVNAEHYKYLENEIDEILWQIAGYSEHWDKLFYKFGLIDGINLDKELKKELEDKLNGKSIK